MNKRNLSTAGLVIFVIGALILILAFLMLSPLFPDKQPQYVFSCISVSLIYLAFFLPTFFGPLRGSAASLAASGTVYYKGLTTYTVISVANIVLAFILFPLAVSVVIQCATLFVLLIWIFMAIVTKNHIDSTTQDEEIKKSVVMQLRSRAAKLTAITAGLDASNDVRVHAEKIAEDMRYLSPGNTAEARDLERRLLTMLDAILMDGNLASGYPAKPLSDKFNDFDAIYRERKNIN